MPKKTPEPRSFSVTRGENFSEAELAQPSPVLVSEHGRLVEDAESVEPAADQSVASAVGEPAQEISVEIAPPFTNFEVVELASCSVTCRWTVSRRSSVIVQRKLATDADFVTLKDCPIPTAVSTSKLDSVPSDAQILYRVAAVEDGRLSEFVERSIKTSDRSSKLLAMRSIREQIAEEEAENARVAAENRQIAMKRYVEIIQNPDGSAHAGQSSDLRQIMIDLAIKPEHFEKDCAIIRELNGCRRNVAANPPTDPKKLAAMNSAMKQLEKDLRQAELDLVRYRATGSTRVGTLERIRTIAGQRPEFFQPVTSDGQIKLLGES